MALCVVCASVCVALYVGHLVLPRADTFLARMRVASTSFRHKSNDLRPSSLTTLSLALSLFLCALVPHLTASVKIKKRKTNKQKKNTQNILSYF